MVVARTITFLSPAAASRLHLLPRAVRPSLPTPCRQCSAEDSCYSSSYFCPDSLGRRQGDNEGCFYVVSTNSSCLPTSTSASSSSTTWDADPCASPTWVGCHISTRDELGRRQEGDFCTTSSWTLEGCSVVPKYHQHDDVKHYHLGCGPVCHHMGRLSYRYEG